MIIAIIGGVIVTAGVIIFFSFAGSTLLEMLIGDQAVKAWVQISAGVQKAYTTGGSVLPGWSLDWLDCTYVTSDEYSNPYCGWYYSSGGSAAGHYGKTYINRFNAILFLNWSSYNDIKNKINKNDKESLDVLSNCGCSSKKCDCICLASIKSDNFDEYPKYFRVDYPSPSEGNWIVCAWGTSSFITYDNESTFMNIIDKITLLQCSKSSLPVEVKYGDKYERLLAIQHFEGELYLTREKSSKGYFIYLNFKPKYRPDWDGSGNPPNGGCAFVNNRAYFT